MQWELLLEMWYIHQFLLFNLHRLKSLAYFGDSGLMKFELTAPGFGARLWELTVVRRIVQRRDYENNMH